ncbi:TetR/AcrR family transcriptional regulator [Thermohalobacter berrensis]|uniref:HTH tetR-type domain-containing protein n=1 Tax=Thermohalobacter berrensis TaxID=99594 RepID=A0A419SW64_9FIRM|nr:TetR/AcrR family transcriptional regulator [Thermohalobacter berrensis]RKD29483.1 hypothetical protein BET03_05335 [Thermohalobacter berrensis]
MNIKKQIINATLDLIERHGLKNLRVDEIAASAGISKRTLYRYFPSKKALISFIVIEKQKYIISQIEKIFEKPNDEISKYEKLITFVTKEVSKVNNGLFESLKKYPELYEKIKEGQNQWRLKIEKLIEVGIKKGEISPEFEPKIVAFLLIKLANSIFDPDFYINNKVTFKEVSDNLKRMVLKGIVKRD